MKKLIFGLIFTCCLLGNLTAQNREQYIAQFSVIAVAEMHRSGIPASIKLAQAILESNAGASMLAVQANNHFGIKCGSAWKGKKMYRKDDDRNGQGKLIKSCFRQFSSAQESFIAHSDFLMDPRKEYRYGPLFELAPDDYKAWAHGLKKAGYATNSRYPQLLIRIIEDYDLHEFDRSSDFAKNEEIEVVKDNPHPSAPNAPNLPKTSYSPASSAKQSIDYHNGVKFVRARESDNAKKLAEKFDIPVKRILRYNKKLRSVYSKMAEGERIYLQPKRETFRGKQKYHIVKPGETLNIISDMYGMKVKSLRKRNDIPKGKEPAINEKIVLKGRTRSRVKVQKKQTRSQKSSEYLWEEAQGVTNTEQEEVQGQVTYTVQKSDTLYGISRSHGITVDKLKKVNNLGNDSIHPGQVLIIQ